MPPVAKTNGANGKASVADTLAAGPASFLELMAAAGSRDGREIVRELERQAESATARLRTALRRGAPGSDH